MWAWIEYLIFAILLSLFGGDDFLGVWVFNEGFKEVFDRSSSNMIIEMANLDVKERLFIIKF